MIDKMFCGLCKFFREKKGQHVGEGYCVITPGVPGVEVRSLQNACPSFKPKLKPGEHASRVAISAETLQSMAHDMATKAFYDRVDWRVGNTPMYVYPKVEKALRKWFKELGVEVVEKS